MNWKKYPYWKKGAIICAVISAVIYIIMDLYFLRAPPEYFVFILAAHLPVSFLVVMLEPTGLSLMPALIILFILGVVFWAIIGALAGLIINKIMKKHKTKKTQHKTKKKRKIKKK